MNRRDVLIPCKRFTEGKSRLASALDSGARAELCRQFLLRTIAVATTITEPGAVVVVSPDTEVLALATGRGVRVVLDPDRGLNAALRWAEASRRDETVPARALMILPIDLPDASAEALRAVLDAFSDVTIAPDRDGSGTNVMKLSAGARRGFCFAYGPDSCARHLAHAAARGLSVMRVDDARLSFDVDQPTDHAAWSAGSRRAHPRSVETDRYAVQEER